MHNPATMPLAGMLQGNLPNPGFDAQVYLSSRVFGRRADTSTLTTLAINATTINAATIAASNALTLTKAQNGATDFTVTNSTSGTAAQARFVAVSSANSALMGQYSAGSNTYGALLANYGYMYATGPGLVLMVDNASGILKIATGGNSERWRVDTTGRLSNTGADGTAYLALKAGTAAASTAPLKFTSGSLLTTAEAGAVEFLTDKSYLTITTGAARKEFTLNDAALTSGKMPVGTTNGRLTDGPAWDGTTLTSAVTGALNGTLGATARNTVQATTGNFTGTVTSSNTSAFSGGFSGDNDFAAGGVIVRLNNNTDSMKFYTNSVLGLTISGAVTPAAAFTGAATVAGGFGCNAKTAQTAYASGGALNAYGAGVNGLDSAANMSALHAMVVSIRTALVANGIMS